MLQSTPTTEVPYVVADAEIGYEDIPLFQRMIPECDSLEAKVDWLVRDMLAYLIRWYALFWILFFRGGRGGMWECSMVDDLEMGKA